MPKQINKHYQTLKDAGYTLETRPGSEGYNQLYAIKDGEEMAGVEYHAEPEGHDLKNAQYGLRQDEALYDLCDNLGLDVQKTVDRMEQEEALMEDAQHHGARLTFSHEESGLGFSFPDASAEEVGATYEVLVHDLVHGPGEDHKLGPVINSFECYSPDGLEGAERITHEHAVYACADFVLEECADHDFLKHITDLDEVVDELAQNEGREAAYYTAISEEAGVGFSFRDATREQLGGAMTYQIGIHELTENGELGKELDVMTRYTPEEGTVYPDAIRACAEEVMDRLAEKNQGLGQGQDLEEPLELRWSKMEGNNTPSGNPRYEYSLRIDDNEYRGKYVGYDPKGQMKEQAMQDHPSIAGEIQNAVVKHDDLKKYGAENYRGKEEDRPQDTDISVTMRRAEDRSHTPGGVPRWEYTAEFQGEKRSGKANGYEGPDIDNAIAKKLQKDWPEAMDKAEGITLKEDKVNVHKPEKASKKEEKKEEGLAM